MHTELGRIAALSERVEREESPLERQVRRVAWLIALIAVVTGVAFVPLATLGAGLSLSDAVVFAVGLLVGNVPEGLLPVITLALAVGVRDLVRRGAVVKRLSAVETLGSTDVICTDKTGTLTENRMRVTAIWTAPQTLDVGRRRTRTDAGAGRDAAARSREAMAACNNAQLDGADGEATGDPTEVALLEAAAATRASTSTPHERERQRRRQFHFDPALKLMSTVDERDGALWVDTKGAPEALLPRCTTIAGEDGRRAAARRPPSAQQLDRAGRRLRRAGACACWRSPSGGSTRHATLPERREQAERDLCLLGLVAMLDPPRPEVADAVAALPRGRHPDHRRHRRPRPDRGRDRAARRHRRRRADRDHRRASSTG